MESTGFSSRGSVHDYQAKRKLGSFKLDMNIKTVNIKTSNSEDSLNKITFLLFNLPDGTTKNIA